MAGQREHKEQPRITNTPNYYSKGKIEVIDFITDQRLDFIEGNVVKYICRWKQKDGLHDLMKAKRYLEILIEKESAELVVMQTER